MINKEEVNLRDDLLESYGSPYGFEYKDTIFLFETIDERNYWLTECSVEDLDYVIKSEEEIPENGISN